MLNSCSQRLVTTSLQLLDVGRLLLHVLKALSSLALHKLTRNHLEINVRPSAQCHRKWRPSRSEIVLFLLSMRSLTMVSFISTAIAGREAENREYLLSSCKSADTHLPTLSRGSGQQKHRRIKAH